MSNSAIEAFYFLGGKVRRDKARRLLEKDVAVIEEQIKAHEQEIFRLKKIKIAKISHYNKAVLHHA